PVAQPAALGGDWRAGVRGALRRHENQSGDLRRRRPRGLRGRRLAVRLGLPPEIRRRPLPAERGLSPPSGAQFIRAASFASSAPARMRRGRAVSVPSLLPSLRAADARSLRERARPQRRWLQRSSLRLMLSASHGESRITSVTCRLPAEMSRLSAARARRTWLARARAFMHWEEPRCSPSDWRESVRGSTIVGSIRLRGMDRVLAGAIVEAADIVSPSCVSGISAGFHCCRRAPSRSKEPGEVDGPLLLRSRPLPAPEARG